MRIDPINVANALLQAANGSGADVEMRISVGAWSATDLCGFVDHIIDNLAAQGLRLKGIRADPTTFNKLGLRVDINTQNSGSYRGNIVVISAKYFDFIELVVMP